MGLTMAFKITGSPPHTRERLALVVIAIAALGITPAYAGKTCLVINTFNHAQDHPRIRGKDSYDP